MKAATGVAEEQVLAESAEEKTVEDWSADGQYLVWGVDATGYEWLFSFRDHKILPFLQAKFMQTRCRFSPNHGGPPRWIAYSSYETGSQQVYVRSFAGVLSGSGGKWQISSGGGSEPLWRGDGKEIFYLNGNKVMAVEVNGDGESFRAGIPKELFEVLWIPKTPSGLKMQVLAPFVRSILTQQVPACNIVSSRLARLNLRVLATDKDLRFGHIIGDGQPSLWPTLCPLGQPQKAIGHESFQKPWIADSGSFRNDQLKAKLLCPFGE